MEQIDSDDHEPASEVDPATQAFARLEGEMALVRRAVEHLAAEKAEIVIPDYSRTLGEMAKRLGVVAQGLNTIADRPAMQFTPEGLAARIEVAAQGARRTDQTALAEARERFDRGSQTMREIAGTAHTARQQRRRLGWAAGGGLLAGMLLWSFLPGVALRTLPQSWHMPENMARHIVGEPTLWEAGTRLMRTGSPQAWNAITDAANMLRNNRATVERCREAARRTHRSIRCSIEIS